MLKPVDNEAREIKMLDGLWHFAQDPDDGGEGRGWHSSRLPGALKMPVPASYNDLTQDPALRDHVGAVWYQREVWVPRGWSHDDIEIRIGAAGNHATVWWDGICLGTHRGAFLPFSVSLGELTDEHVLHLLTIRVNNRLTFADLPTGNVVAAGMKRPGYTGKRVHQDSFHDFYNYSGIHRSVMLLHLPRHRIEAINVTSSIEGKLGILNWNVKEYGERGRLKVRLLDANAMEVAQGEGFQGSCTIENVHPWAPESPHLYLLQCDLLEGDKLVDRYALPVGIRTVSVSKDAFLLNGKPFYFRGVGKHEDSVLFGRGHNSVVLTKDFAMMEWLGANSFRTSHYPYDEEWLDEADRRGIAVIGEVPAVGFNPWNEKTDWFTHGKVDQHTLANHLADIEALIARDAHHPCIVAWNLLVEAPTYEEGALPYAEALVKRTRELDPTRPLTFEQSSRPEACRVQQLADFICVSRYYGWYENTGDLDEAVLTQCLMYELKAWRERFGQPVFMLEFGADTIAGMHSDPPVMFSEEYQVEIFRLYSQVLDQCPWIIGEHIWNLADFATKQGLNRMMGNRKGILTRDRQPKMGAHFLKRRWKSVDESGRPSS
ncbi:MAG TPA: beta-glucuronidase [Candidatus Methylacidiphilales bacterium]|nr:beta-glucuronidase [Candidatus Methylacidiphilales bacterium]